MTTRRLLLAGLIMLAIAWLILPAGASGQSAAGPELALSSIATIAVDIPEAAADLAVAGDPVTYGIVTAPGFRVVGPASAPVDLREGDPRVLLLTLNVGPALPAGMRTAALVLFRTPAQVDTVEVEVKIAAVAGFRLSLARSGGPAAPGSRAGLSFEVTNQGNVADTLALELDSRLGPGRDLPAALALGPFETVRGELSIEVAASALPLPTLVVARAVGRHDTAFATLEMPVGQPDGFLSSFVRMPTRVFFGSSVRGTGPGDVTPVYGIEAEGRLREGLGLRVEAHGANGAASNFAFRGLHLGPRIRAQLTSQVFRLEAGDVSSRTTPFAGYRLNGRGAAIEVSAGKLQLLAHAAAPASSDGLIDGVQLSGGVDLRIRAMVVGLHGLREDRLREALFPDQTLQSGWVHLESAVPTRHTWELDGGWLTQDDLESGEHVEGPAVAGRYAYRDETSTVDLIVRRRPTLARARSVSSNELRASGLTRVYGTAGVAGQLYRIEGPGNVPESRQRTDGLELGAFVAGAEERYELLGRVRRFRGVDTLVERTIEGRVDMAAGPGSFDARLEVGRARGPTVTNSAILRTAGGYSLYGSRGWGRIGFSFRRDASGAGQASLDLTGAWQLSRTVELHGSYGGSVDRLDPDAASLVQLGVQVELQPGLALLGGLEKVRTAQGEAVQVSMGIRTGLSLPVPFPRQDPVRGTVFEDLDGDGRRSPDEPFLDGLRLTMGTLTVESRRGYFAFPVEAQRHPVQVETTSLEPGFLPPPPMVVPAGGSLDIPVHRASSLRVETFLDANRDGHRDATEMPLSDVEIEVAVGDQEGWAFRTASDGSIELAAIRPGSYVISVNPATLPPRAAAPGLVSSTIRAGEAATVSLAVPARPMVLMGSSRQETSPASDVENDEGGRR